MTLIEICAHERAGMATRHLLGYDQHDDHLWRWLNHHLANWSRAHPIKVMMPPIEPEVAHDPWS